MSVLYPEPLSDDDFYDGLMDGDLPFDDELDDWDDDDDDWDWEGSDGWSDESDL
jgi:hypothetical protein